MSLEDVIGEINEAGLRINNLFQTDEGWQANLRQINGACLEFGKGKSALTALAGAFKKFGGTVVTKSVNPKPKRDLIG